jgi:hypothetical protein
MGTGSPKTEVVFHNGGQFSSTFSFLTSRETSSAMIAFSNSTADGDAADWIEQVLSQSC